MNISSTEHFDLMLILFTFLCNAVRNFPSRRRAGTTCNKQHTTHKKNQTKRKSVLSTVWSSNTSSNTVLSCHHTKPNHAALYYTAFHYIILYNTHQNYIHAALYTSYKVEAVISVVSFLMPHVTTGTAERPELLRARNRFRR